jgi:hypothetical protein
VMRRTFSVGFGVAVLAAVAGVSHGQQAVQWRVEDGGNGHWYQVLPPIIPAVFPEDAFLVATSLGGHAASVTSPEENAFCCSVAEQQVVLLGIRKEKGTNAGGWVTGEAWSFNGWWSDAPWWNGEGNNVGERWGLLHPDWPECRWQDIGPTQEAWSLLVEWSADCDGNGVVDYGEILDGTLEDANANGVPDCCDAGTSCEPCEGDVTGNGLVDGLDLAAVLGAWGTNGKGEFPTDRNNDGIVDAQDLALVLSGWGKCP